MFDLIETANRGRMAMSQLDLERKRAANLAQLVRDALDMGESWITDEIGSSRERLVDFKSERAAIERHLAKYLEE